MMKGKMVEWWPLLIDINLRLGRDASAASILEWHHSNLNLFYASAIRKDYVKAEKLFQDLKLQPVARYEMLFRLYVEGRIVTERSADMAINVACDLEAPVVHNYTLDSSVIMAGRILNYVLKLHKTHPNGNPAIEGFDTGKNIDQLLLASLGLCFRNNSPGFGFELLGELEQRHPEIMKNL